MARRKGYFSLVCSYLRNSVRKLLSKGAQGYLTFLINTPGTKLEVKDVPVVGEYPDVFPNELVTLPLERGGI